MATTSYNIYQQITSVRLATTSNLSGNYFNGQLNNGVGSTLTASSTGSLLVDGVLAQVGDRLLLNNQTNVNENGIYVVKAAGSSVGIWLLERAPDFQSVEQLKVGQFFSVGAGNTLAGALYILVEPLPVQIGTGSASFNFVDVSTGGGGPYLTIAGNLSDVSNVQDSISNLGFGNGQILQLNDSDFSGGIYTLTNPCPNFIEILCNNPGNEIRLPLAQGLGAFSLSFGPQFNSIGLESVDINLNSGSSFTTLVSRGGLFVKLSDNSTLDGSWLAVATVTALNGILTGNGELTSNDGSVTISPSQNTNSIDFSVSSSTGVTLQAAYDNGDNANVLLSNNRPISFINGSSAAEVNVVTTEATGTNTVANYRVFGWTFIPSVDMIVTSLQYDDSLFTTAYPRDTGIYNKNTEELLASATILQSDPLDSTNTFRTKTLNNPVLLSSGTEYVFATVIPANESSFSNEDAVVSNITVTGYASGPSSSSPVTLQFPTSFTVLADALYIGSFQYEEFTGEDDVNIYDSTTDNSVIFEVNSTTRSSHPLPSMTTVQRDAIAAPQNGDAVFATDVSPKRAYIYTGDWSGLAYLTDLPNVPTLNQGQLIIGVDSSPAIAGYLVSSDSSINIDLSTNGEIDITLNSTSSDTLQDAYDNGNVIEVVAGRPLLINASQAGSVTNGVTTSSTGININSNYNIFGYTFVPSSNIIITSFQVEDSTLGVGQVRTLAIYEKSTGVQLTIGTVSKTDSLVGAYRTNALSNPILLSGAIEYVLTAIVPPAQTYRNNADAVAGADISITEFASGDSQAFPIPMSAPTSYTATANVTPYGAFQYQLETVISTFLVQNESSAFFMQAKSTTQATIPAPVMTNAEWTAIASPEAGMTAFISDATPSARPGTFDGVNYHQYAYIDENQSGSFSATVSNVSGTSGISVIKAMVNAPLVAVGYTAEVALEFSYTATATTQVVTIDVPVIAANNFSNANQATLMGGSVYVNGSPAIGDGTLLDVVADVGFTRVQLGILTADTTGTKVVSVSFMYVIQ